MKTLTPALSLRRERGAEALAMLVCLLLTACSPPPASRGGFDSDDPASKLYAIHRAGTRGDRSVLPKLVEQLESDDPAVRMLAIQALERLTGERLGYNPYGSAVERRPAVEAWVEAVRSGRFDR